MTRPILISKDNGVIEIVVESTFLFFFKTHKTYRATKRIVGDYYSWVMLPNQTIVPDHMSFQLDQWLKLGGEKCQ